MAVLRLVDFTNKDTIAALRCLLADALNGEVVGLALCYRYKNGVEESVFTGSYRVRPGEAVNAAMRLGWKLTQAQDEMTGPP